MWTVDELAAQVKDMRDKQRRYFKTRGRQELIEARQAEVKVDETVAALLGSFLPPAPPGSRIAE